MISLQNAYDQWASDIRPGVIETYGENEVALSESWNDYTDSLCKEGDLTDLQYHYCPAHDEPMPAGDDADYILDQMGVDFDYSVADQPQSDLFKDNDWPAGTVHYDCTLSRGRGFVDFPFSKGPALSGPASREEILQCLFMDKFSVDGALGFEDWAEEFAYDSDSRRAERIYDKLVEQSAVLDGMFTEGEIEDLSELLEAI